MDVEDNPYYHSFLLCLFFRKQMGDLTMMPSSRGRYRPKSMTTRTGAFVCLLALPTSFLRQNTLWIQKLPWRREETSQCGAATTTWA